MDERIRKINLENRVEQEESHEYLQMVVEEMMEKYGISSDEVSSRMKSSGFVDLFNTDPYFYFHYSPEDTADMIYSSKITQKH